MSLLIENATLLNWGDTPQVTPDQAVYIADGQIAAIGDSAALRASYPQAERWDADGQLLMPGGIVAHTHFYGAYARGMAIPGAPMAEFPEILRRLWWQLDKALDADAVRLSALVMLIDAIKHGVTTLFDHHASPNAIGGSLDWIGQAVEQAGLRAVLCYEVTDRDGLDKMQAGIEENLRWLAACRDKPRLAGTFGLHASLSLSDESLRACAAALPAGVGVHVHVAEHEADEQDSLARAGLRVVQRLESFGLWRPNSVAAHCVHIDEAERRLLAERGVWVTHQPRSNMNNAVGAMALQAMLDDGVKLCLGTDGFSNNLWAEWRAAYFLHKVVHRDARQANGADIARMATVNNARLAEAFFPGKRLGVLEVGAQADLILVDYRPFTPLTGGNAPWHVIFGFETSMVTGTLVDGKILMRDRRLQTLDERAILREALAHAPQVWASYGQYVERYLQAEA